MPEAGECDGCGEFSCYLTTVVATTEPYGPPADFCPSCLQESSKAVPADQVNLGIMDPKSKYG